MLNSQSQVATFSFIVLPQQHTSRLLVVEGAMEDELEGLFDNFGVKRGISDVVADDLVRLKRTDYVPKSLNDARIASDELLYDASYNLPRPCGVVVRAIIEHTEYGDNVDQENESDGTRDQTPRPDSMTVDIYSHFECHNLGILCRNVSCLAVASNHSRM